MQRGKTAIGNLDRVAFCPPAGHLTSSYWAAIASHAVAAVRFLGTEILVRDAGLPLLNRIEGFSSTLSSAHFLPR